MMLDISNDISGEVIPRTGEADNLPGILSRQVSEDEFTGKSLIYFLRWQSYVSKSTGSSDFFKLIYIRVPA